DHRRRGGGQVLMHKTRALGLALLGAVALGAACNVPDVFTCSAASQCVHDGTAGRCESSGFCSFADDSCAGGYRYGGFSGEGSSQCVGGAPMPDAPAGGSPDARPGSPDARPGSPDARPGSPDAAPPGDGGVLVDLVAPVTGDTTLSIFQPSNNYGTTNQLL